MQQAFYDMLIESAKEASQRARWIFTAASIVALIQLVSVFNLVLGGGRGYTEAVVYGAIVLPSPSASAGLSPRERSQAEALADLRQGMIRNWAEAQKVKISPLGMEFDAGDAGIIGGVAFVVVLLWLFFAMRRENHIIGKMLLIAAEEPQPQRAHVFFALNSSQVFATLSENDGPFTPAGPQEETRAPLVRAALAGLTFLPAFAMLSAILADVSSVYWLGAVYRGSPETLTHVPGFALDARFLVTLAVELLLFVFVVLLCGRVHGMQHSTRELLRHAQQQGWNETTPEHPARWRTSPKSR
jgi:hypothetical protein